MIEVEKDDRTGLRLRVEQAAQARDIKEGRWVVTWRIRNSGGQPLRILSGRLPHGKFRGEEREFSPALQVLPNKSTDLDFTVSCNEPPGAQVENAFLILRVLRLEEPWWIFVRLRVIVNGQGEPGTVTELITTKKVGFSSA